MATKGSIDIVVNLRTPREMGTGLNPTDETFRKQTRQSDPALITGVEVEDYLRKMDRAGIERSILCAIKSGPSNVPGPVHLPYERVAEVCAQYPDRFSGAAGIEPNLGMEQLRQLEYAVKELGFVSAHYYPHWFDIPPEHPYMYPVYAKCVELDVPIMIHVGHNLVYTRQQRLPSCARPISFDRIQILLPELKLVGIHMGTPWHDEMISMAWKHENVYFCGDAYAPKHWPPQVKHYINTYGQDKFIFGTDWPVIDNERAVKDVLEDDYRPEPFRKMMRDNAIKVFKLPDGGLAERPENWAELLKPYGRDTLLDS